MIDIMPNEIFHIYFSPYTAHAIELDGIVYPTVEHAYQCQRYDDQNIVKEILKAKSPVLAWQTSSKFKPLTKPDFYSNKVSIMKKLMLTKAMQHQDVRDVLLGSGEQRIVKHIFTGPPGDGFWDDGEDGKGENVMGKLWMEIREELRNNK